MGSLLRERCAAIAFFLVTAPLLPAQSYMLVDGQDSPPANTRYVIESVEGRVVVGGGASPPGRVRVALVCGNFVRPGGLADVHGRFKHRIPRHPSLELGIKHAKAIHGTDLGGRQVVYEVSDPALLLPCDVTAELEGYRSTSAEVGLLAEDGVTVVGDRSRIDLGFLILHHLEDLDHYARSSTTSQATGVARRAYLAGIRALENRFPDYERAASRFERAVEAYPGFAGGWSALGLARWILGNDGAALQAFTRAINADPNYLMPYEVMMEMVAESENWEELESLAAAYLELSPDAPLVLYMGVAAAANLDNLEVLRERIDRLEALGERDYLTRSFAMAGAILEQKTSLGEAAGFYEAFIAADPDHHGVPQLKRKLTDWRALGVVDSLPARSAEESPP